MHPHSLGSLRGSHPLQSCTCPQSWLALILPGVQILFCPLGGHNLERGCRPSSRASFSAVNAFPKNGEKKILLKNDLSTSLRCRRGKSPGVQILILSSRDHFSAERKNRCFAHIFGSNSSPQASEAHPGFRASFFPLQDPLARPFCSGKWIRIAFTARFASVWIHSSPQASETWGPEWTQKVWAKQRFFSLS